MTSMWSAWMVLVESHFETGNFSGNTLRSSLLLLPHCHRPPILVNWTLCEEVLKNWGEFNCLLSSLLLQGILVQCNLWITVFHLRTFKCVALLLLLEHLHEFKPLHSYGIQRLSSLHRQDRHMALWTPAHSTGLLPPLDAGSSCRMTWNCPTL